MDIEGFEPHAILGGRKLFESKAVKVVMMEYSRTMLKSKKYAFISQLVFEALDFLINKMGYEVFSFPQNEKLHLNNRTRWSDEVVFALPGFWKGPVWNMEQLKKLEPILASFKEHLEVPMFHQMLNKTKQ